jgi:carboxyl-terminal processing protease
VQSVYTLENDTGMALTTAKYYTPSGRLIQRDYSGSTYELYYMTGGTPAPTDGNRDIKSTDSGRKVYGGGGITPDMLEPTHELNRFEALLVSKDMIFQYTRRLTSGEVPSASNFAAILRNQSSPEKAPKTMPNLEITDAIISDFKDFLRDKKIEFTDQDIQNNLDFIKRRIRQEVFQTAFGLQEGFRVAVQGDTQVKKALEVMPEAKQLMTSGKITPSAAENPAR